MEAACKKCSLKKCYFLLTNVDIFIDFPVLVEQVKMLRQSGLLSQASNYSQRTGQCPAYLGMFCKNELFQLQ